MTFDDELRDLAGRAAQAHVRSDGFASATVKGRVRRARRVYRATVVAGSVAAVAVVGVLGTAVAQRWPDPAPPAETVVPSPEPSPQPQETQTPPPDPVGPVIDGWQDAMVDPEVFGGLYVTDSVSVDGRAVVVGCATTRGADGFPAWFADDAAGWTRASGPLGDGTGSVCLGDVVATPHGLFAEGPLGLFRSDDGSAWVQVVLDPAPAGFGSVTKLFAVGDRLTVLVKRASLNESTVASLYTTTDGRTWSEVTDGSAAVFDNAGVAQVIATGDGLVAVGSSPGGEFVPTAAAWVSSDGLAWELVTPAGPGFEGAAMTAVAWDGTGYTAVGKCSFESGLMCAWSSPDGRVWTPDASPDEQVNAGVAYLQPTALTLVGADLYAAGFDFDASRPEAEQTLAALWRKVAGGAWERVDAETVGVVPFARTEVGVVVVGFWPGRGWPSGAEVRVLTPVE